MPDMPEETEQLALEASLRLTPDVRAKVRAQLADANFHALLFSILTRLLDAIKAATSVVAASSMGDAAGAGVEPAVDVFSDEKEFATTPEFMALEYALG